MYNFMNVLLYIFLYVVYSSCVSINIALHAQVSPNEKIVGSVITTDGIRSAFLLQHPNFVNVVEVFYPFYYLGFFDNLWDLILIEGWFPSINHFIHLARSNNPSAIILFYCLDPSYPGIGIISSLDVDGMLTNSAQVKLNLRAILPTKYVMLAANPFVMKPIENRYLRNGGIVYIGAGGGMVKYKKRLLDMLHAAVPFGLSLYGSHWDEIESLKHVWKGILPRFELANIYSSADIVLASTMDDQGKSGMINNRIFEALSCGAVIISDDWPVLREEFGDILFYTNDAISAATQIQFIFSHPEVAARKRRQARELILQKHSWSHRVVDILSFYQQLKQRAKVGQLVKSFFDSTYSKETKWSKTQNSICNNPRPNAPTLAWVVSQKISSHSDYLIVKDILLSHLCTQYVVYVIQEDLWWKYYQNKTWIKSFDAIFIVSVPFDLLDLSVLDIPPLHTTTAKIKEGDSTIDNITNYDNSITGNLLSHKSFHNSIRKQRRGAYWIGYSYQLIQEAVANYGQSILMADRYDTLWYRDSYDLDLLERCKVTFISYRLQHVFGIPFNSNSKSTSHSWSTGNSTSRSRSTNVLTEQLAEETANTTGTNSRYSTTSDHNNILNKHPPVFLCFISSPLLCTKDIRTSVVSSQNTTVILMGGVWEEWLEIKEVIDVEVLPFIVHCATGTIGDNILMLIQDASLLYILSPGDTYLKLSDTDTATSASPGSNSIIASTVEDELWPLLAAAMSSTRVHLLLLQSHIVYYSGIDCKAWTGDYVKRSVGHGIARLNGFAGVQSVVHINPISSESVTGNDTFHLDAVFTDFILGVDGQCCVLIIEPYTTLACYYREDISIYIKLKANQFPESLTPTYTSLYHSAICPRYRDIVLRVELRGPMFSNPISSANLTVDLNYIMTLWDSPLLKKSSRSDLLSQKMTLTVNTTIL